MSLKLPFGERCTPTRPGRPDSENRPHDLIQEPVAILQTPPIAVGSMIGPGLQKLVDEIAIGCVYFHTVEPRCFGSLGGTSIILHDGRYFIRFQCSRRFIRLFADGRMNRVPVEFDGRRGDRKLLDSRESCCGKLVRSARAVEISACLGHEPHRPLSSRLRFVHRNRFPGCSANRSLFRNHRRFGDDQPGGGSLNVILGHQRVWQTLLAGPRSCQRGHDDPVS